MISLDASLLEERWQGSLVDIAQQQRLVLDPDHRPRKVDLCWVDKVALALIERARQRNRDLTIVYPAPAGDVAVLLAAQILVDKLVRSGRSGTASVGIVTADPTRAQRTWNALGIAGTGYWHEPIATVFPCRRAGPEGESPIGGRRLAGVIIGQRCHEWPVDDLIVDHLAGFVRLDSRQATIEVFSDPVDRGLSAAEAEGRLMWGWSSTDIAAVQREAAQRTVLQNGGTIPFSVASDRLRVIADGVDVRLHATRHPAAEAALARVRDDLRELRRQSPDRRDRHFERGMTAAWHHLSTLVSLPCTPSRFDRFAGLPPRAVRPTDSYVPELSSWAATLTGDRAEVAGILAMDIADLRAALNLGNPVEQMIKEIHEEGEPTVLVTRSGTAEKALRDVLEGEVPGSDLDSGPITVRSIGSLHRYGTFPRAVMVGEPAPWDWHRLLAGLAPVVEVLIIGEKSAAGCEATVRDFRAARDHWGGQVIRARTWEALTGCPAPALPTAAAAEDPAVAVLDGAEYVPEPAPFEALSSLFDLDPLDFDAELSGRAIARVNDRGEWTATVNAVSVRTDHGTVLLESGQPVDVRQGPKLKEVPPESLTPGALILIGRRQGRVGLLNALEHRLRDRSDLLTARFLIDRYRRKVRARFADSGLTVAVLHRALVRLQCDRGVQTVGTWVTDARLAPQQFSDLVKLSEALELGMDADELRHLFAAVQHQRGFRRAAGRILANSAAAALAVSDASQVDPETGLSIADLREAIIEARVIKVVPRPEPVPLTLIGRLESP